MDRRNFLRTMLGVAAVTALPSEVFPFKKIFLPPAPTLIKVQESINDVMALELETFSKAIPDLVYNSTSMYNFMRRHDRINREWLGLSRSTYPGRLTEAEKLSRTMESSIAKIEHDLDEGIRLYGAEDLAKLTGFKFTGVDHEEREIYVEPVSKSSG